MSDKNDHGPNAWMVRRAGETRGPVTREALQGGFEAGLVPPDSEVAAQGSSARRPTKGCLGRKERRRENIPLLTGEGRRFHPSRTESRAKVRRWLSSLATDDRLLLALRQAGHTLTEISTATGRSITAVRVHLLALGRELAERAGVELEAAA
jgi:hypothetical protein